MNIYLVAVCILLVFACNIFVGNQWTACLIFAMYVLMQIRIYFIRRLVEQEIARFKQLAQTERSGWKDPIMREDWPTGR